MIFFEVMGIFATVLIALVILWGLYLLYGYPAVQSISLTRWYSACFRKKTGKDISLFTKWRIFKSYYEVGGVKFSATSNDAGRWSGIGHWVIYDKDE